MAIGVGAKYTYSTWFNNYMKGITFFLVGILFAVGGEFFSTKKKDLFSTGLLGGGIAILYGAVFYSYFLLKILPMNGALAVSLLIALFSIILSVKHSSQTIGILSLIGGFLPFVSYSAMYDLEGTVLYAAAIYIFILNITLLLISFFRQWRIMNFISFVLYIPAMIYMTVCLDSLPLTIAYLLMNFVMYEAVVMAYPLKNKISLRIPEVVLLAFNTLINCLMIFQVLDRYNAESYNGLTALFFALVYISAAKVAERKLPAEKNTALVFYITAMTFAVLMIPFQFGMRWASAGWITEGAILTVTGFVNKEDKIEKAGLGISLFAFLIFYLYDFTNLSNEHLSFFLRFLFFSVMLCVPGFIYSRALYEEKISNGLMKTTSLAYKYAAVFNLWLFLTYCSGRYFVIAAKYMGYDFLNDYYLADIIGMLLTGAAQILTAGILKSSKYIKDKATDGASLFFYIFAVLIVLAVSYNYPVIIESSTANVIQYATLIILILYSIASVILVKNTVFSIVVLSPRN